MDGTIHGLVWHFTCYVIFRKENLVLHPTHMVDARKGTWSYKLSQYSSLLTLIWKECCDEEVQPHRKMDYKPMIYIYINIINFILKSESNLKK